jgi:divalent metal cation (Fe/Co/Zn/Cd) transporter
MSLTQVIRVGLLLSMVLIVLAFPLLDALMGCTISLVLYVMLGKYELKDEDEGLD